MNKASARVDAFVVRQGLVLQGSQRNAGPGRAGVFEIRRRKGGGGEVYESRRRRSHEGEGA